MSLFVFRRGSGRRAVAFPLYKNPPATLRNSVSAPVSAGRAAPNRLRIGARYKVEIFPEPRRYIAYTRGSPPPSADRTVTKAGRSRRRLFRGDESKFADVIRFFRRCIWRAECPRSAWAMRNLRGLSRGVATDCALAECVEVNVNGCTKGWCIW